MVMVAHQVPSGIGDCTELLQRVAEKPSLAWAWAKDIRPEAFLALYESPATVEDAFWKAAAAFGDLDGMAVLNADPRTSARWMRHFLLWIKRILRGRGDMVERSVDFVCADYYHRRHLPELRQAVNDGHLPSEAVQAIMTSPEIVFALGVAAPCWLQYQTSPWALYEQACEGKFEAIEQLLTIDSAADHAPKLAKRMVQILQENPEQYAALQRVKGKLRKKLQSRVDLKFLLGAFLMKLSRALHCIFNGEILFAILEVLTPAEEQPELKREIKEAKAIAARHPPKRWLSASNIRELFDAYAQDNGQGMFDPDFVQAPESAERQFRRKVDCWPELWKSDKTRAA